MGDIEKYPESDSEIHKLESSDIKDYDVAFKFLNDKNEKGRHLDSELPPKLLRKIDWRILTFLCAIYFLQFLDKTLLNYSAAMGIKKNLVGSEFSNLSTIFYASYIFAEPFMAFMLQKFPISKAFSICIVLWGIVLACHAACNTYASLMVVRTLLGIFESSSAVGVIAISGMYYNKSEQVSRMGIWSINSGTATIVGAILSFAFQHVHTVEFKSWQILFLVVGFLTFVFGAFVWFYLPNNVTSALFLDEEEKLLVLEHIRGNQTGTENKKFKREQLYELLFRDALTWPMLLLTITSQIVTGAIGTYSVTVIGTFGFDRYTSALVQIPLGAIIIIIIIIATQLVSRYGHRTYICASMYVPSIIGAIVLLTTDLTTQRIGNLLALYLLYSGSSSITLIYAWNSANTAGYTKRMFRNALTMVFFSLASLIGPQMFQAHDFPEYTPAKVAILVTQIVSIPLTFLVGYLSRRENTKRSTEPVQHAPENYQFLDLTDIENRNFRYSY